MNVIYTVLFAFAFGYFVKQRGVAIALYLAVDALVFSFQSLSLVLSWLAHESPSAFGDFPDQLPVQYSQSELFGYGVINLVIVLAGVGLVTLGGWVRARRTARRPDVVSVG